MSEESFVNIVNDVEKRIFEVNDNVNFHDM